MNEVYNKLKVMYDVVIEIKNSKYACKSDTYWYLYNNDEIILSKLKYLKVIEEDTSIIIKDEENYHILDFDYNKTTILNYEKIEYVESKMYIAYVSSDYCGIIRKDDTTVVPFIYNSIEKNGEHINCVSLLSTIIIDKNGNKIRS